MKAKIDCLVSFDTTGSMYPVLTQVRREVEEFTKQLFGEFTDLRLGVIVHGDYCDKDDPYTIKAMDLTRDEEELCKFIRETKSTYGGDADECYELVLNTAHSVINWRPDAEKIMIMIGDASPHSPSYPQNTMNLDWKEEAEELRKQGIKVFSVHALAHYRSSSRAFYKTVAEQTNGVYLTLDMFNEIVDLIKATCYQQGGEEKLNEFITIIKDSGRMTHSMNNNFKRLRGEEVEDDYSRYSAAYSKRDSKRARTYSKEEVTIKDMEELVPVLPGRFQVMTIDENCAIKQFVESNGITFKKGRGFYELSKAETVQQYKEVIMQDRETGEMFTGSQVRERLGLQPQSEKGGVKERLHKADAEKFRVFVQSTSVNRKLIAGTTFLYEINDIEDTGTIISESEVKDLKKSKKKTEKVSKTVTKESATPKTKRVKKSEVADTEKKVKATTKAMKELTKVEAPKIDNIAKSIEKVKKQTEKITDGLVRYETSRNKKNTTYLANNLRKLIEESQKLLDSIK